LAQRLLEKETLSLPDIVDILGQRPYPLKDNVLEYLQELRERDENEKEESKDSAPKVESDSEEEDGTDKQKEENKDEAKKD
jgi:hypothetical protein